ncbi:MAG: hypothetical protein RJA49_2769 [Actinomycetota bacterium]
MSAAADDRRTPVERVIDALAAAGCNPKERAGGKWSARCPVSESHARGDRNPSLEVAEGNNGCALITCHGMACTWAMVARRLSLAPGDLFPPKPVSTMGRRELLREYHYRALDGTHVLTVQRWREADGAKSFLRTPKGVRDVPLYNAPEVAATIARGGIVVLPEGERDAESATAAWAHLGGVGTTNVGGAGKWSPAYTEALRGADVVIIADNDTAGRGHADMVAIHLDGVASRVRVLLPAEGHKDLTDHLGAGLGIDELVPLAAAPEPPEEASADDDDDDWAPIDVLVVARRMEAGEWKPALPTVLAVAGSSPLFYPARLNSLFGESGGGKTWIVMLAIIEQLKLGVRVLLIDYEDNVAGTVERLLLLGATLDDLALLTYVSPVTGLVRGVESAVASGTEYSLIVLDSTGEAMAAGGIDGNSDSEAAQWFALLKTLMRATGDPAIVVLDHIPKAADVPSAYAIGSQRKRAAITGASYRVDTVKPFAKGRSGRLKLVVAKDRMGTRPSTSTAAVVDVDAEDGLTFSLHLSEAQEAEARGERFRPTVLMERLSRWLEINTRQPKSAVLSAVSGKAKHLRDGLDLLVEEGFVEIVAGERNALLCVSRRAFRADAETPQPVDNSVSDGSPSAPAGPRSRYVPELGPELRPLGPLPEGGPRRAGGGGTHDLCPAETDQGDPPVDNLDGDPWGF